MRPVVYLENKSVERIYRSGMIGRAIMSRRHTNDNKFRHAPLQSPIVVRSRAGLVLSPNDCIGHVPITSLKRGDYHGAMSWFVKANG